MISEQGLYFGIIGGYLLIIFGIAGYIAKEWIDDPGDFMIAGREMGSWMVAFGMLGILVSGGFVPGIVLQGYTFGFGGVWFYWGWGLGHLLVLLTWLRFWRDSGAYTPAEYYEYMFGVSGRISTLLASIVAMGMIAAYQFVGSGVLVAGLVGIEPATAIIGIGIITMAYAAVSGMWGITISDGVQFAWVFLTVFFALPLLLYINHGLPTSASAEISGQMMSFPFGTMPVLNLAGGTVISWMLLHFFLANTAYYWVRASTARNEKALRNGYLIAIFMSFVVGFIGVLLGLWARMLVDPASPDAAFGLLLAEEMPLWLAALAASGVIAATMSTVDVIYQGCANTITRDIIQRFTDITDQNTVLRLSQLWIIVVGIPTIIVALLYPGALDELIQFAFSFGAPFAVLSLDAWLIRYGTKEGVVAMVVTVMPTAIYWEFSPYVDQVQTLWIAGLVSFVMFYGISTVVRVTGPWWNDPVENTGDQAVLGTLADDRSKPTTPQATDFNEGESR